MAEKAADAAAVGDQDDGQAAAGAVGLDGIQYCSEHPYRPGAAAAAVAGGGICAFCLQEKLGRLVYSSKSSPFFPVGGHPPPSASPSPPPSFRRMVEAPPRLHSAASRKLIPFHRKKTSSSSSSSSASAVLSASMAGGGLKRSKSVAPRPEEQFLSSALSVMAKSPRKKSFWSFLYLSSSASYAHQTATSTPYANGGAAAARRKSVSVASAAWASRGGAAAGAQDQQLRAGTSSASGRRLEVIGEPEPGLVVVVVLRAEGGAVALRGVRQRQLLRRLLGEHLQRLRRLHAPARRVPP